MAMRGQDGYDFGMGAGASVKKGKGKKKTAAKKAAAKGDFKPGGSYGTGRAIPPAPGTKYTGGSKKDSNMAKAQQRARVTTPKPSKGPSKNTNKKLY